MSFQHMMRASNGTKDIQLVDSIVIGQSDPSGNALTFTLADFTKPLLEGDLLIAVGFSSRGGGGVSWTSPAAFTEAFDQAATPSMLVAYRVVGTPQLESLTYTFTPSNGTNAVSGALLLYRNAKFYKVTGATATGGAGSSTFTIPGDTTTTNFDHVLPLILAGDAGPSTYFNAFPSGGSPFFDSRPEVVVSMKFGTQPSFVVFGLFPEGSDLAGNVPAIDIDMFHFPGGISEALVTADAAGIQIILLRSDTNVIQYSSYSQQYNYYGLSSTATSSTFTITSGTGTPTLSSGVTMSVNGGAFGAAQAVTAGDTVALQYTTGASYNVTTNLTFTVLGVTHTWIVGTLNYAIFTSSTTFAVPQGVTSISMLCVGGGGGSGAATAYTYFVFQTTYYAAGGGGGGGGGGLSYTNNVSVTPGESLTVNIGNGGGAGGAGGTSSIIRSGTTLVSAVGGAGGGSASNTAANATNGGGGAGGSSASGVGSVKFSGGSGGSGAGITSSTNQAYGNGGIGGGSATTAGNGTNGAAGSLVNNTIAGGDSGRHITFGASSWTITTPARSTAVQAGQNYSAGGGGGWGVAQSASIGANPGTQGAPGIVVFIWTGRTFSTASTY